ncbi:hypothetical protein [Candidiatus Paracoxiella cheracis]|uniref:hypothetical protein n=1 Tax=Candidiatus Paracoxiella cheracis TaxID=3405120 RepID=UPI003BF483DD
MKIDEELLINLNKELEGLSIMPQQELYEVLTQISEITKVSLTINMKQCTFAFNIPEQQLIPVLRSA